MAKIIVAIDMVEPLEILQKELFDNPDPKWFENEDVTTKKIAIYSAYLTKDPIDDCFYTFELIGVKK